MTRHVVLCTAGVAFAMLAVAVTAAAVIGKAAVISTATNGTTTNGTAAVNGTAANQTDPRADVVYELAELAFNRLMTHNCFEVYDQEKCTQLSDMSPKDVRVYFGGLLANNDTVVAVMPDGDAQLSGRPHDAFLVLDPFPTYKFGHPVFMFYVDVRTTVWKCEDTEGIYTTLNNNMTACVQMVRSRRCNERPMTSSWDCQVTFLPLIVPKMSERRQADNVLNCMSSKDTFLMACPLLRKDGTDLSDECNHLKTNNKGCGRDNFKCSSQKPVNQAVMLFGGWSRLVADYVEEYALGTLRNQLVSWGFAENHIQTFFANSIKKNDDDDGTEDSIKTTTTIAISNMEPADKFNIRRYIKGVCSASQCADTFFLYLASPARQDGNALLWDANGNGIVESDEIYSPREFLQDISFCSARRVVVFVDQSYSGLWALHAQNVFRRVENVMIIPSCGVDDWIPRHSFNAYMRESSKGACLLEYIKPFQESQIMPPVFTGLLMEQEMKNVSILGVNPCVKTTRHLNTSQ